MGEYGIKGTKEDIERIIEGKKRRLDSLEHCWNDFTRHMECGEIRELKQSCIDDEIIIECLEKCLSNTHKVKFVFKETNELAKELAEKALDQYLYEGKTIRQWVEIIINSRLIPCSERMPEMHIQEAKQEHSSIDARWKERMLNTFLGGRM